MTSDRAPNGSSLERASSCLQSITGKVRRRLLPVLPAIPGTWHPSGFMVFRLGWHPEMGSLRLHIWPAGLRRRNPKGLGLYGGVPNGDIHDHAWSVTSQAIARYSDNLYAAVPGPTDLASAQMQVYQVEYVSLRRQTLVPTASAVFVEVSQTRSLAPGDQHTIAPGTFHAPTIPPGVTGATLVLDSLPVLDGTRVLIAGGRSNVYHDVRWPVLPNEATLAQKQLISQRLV